MCIEERPCKDTGRRWQLASQGQGPPKKVTLPNQHLNLSLPAYGTVRKCLFFKPLSVVLYYDSPSRLTQKDTTSLLWNSCPRKVLT